MKTIIYPVTIALVICISAFTVVNAISWKIADGYFIKFTSNDPSGAFTSLKGDVVFDENDLAASKFDVKVAAESINTGNGMKNSKAKSAQYFDVQTYPEIKFTSTKISKKGDKYEAKGNLVMHGVTKETTIPFSFSKTTGGGMFTGSFDVNRKDFKIGEPGGHTSDVLKIDLSVPVTQ